MLKHRQENSINQTSIFVMLLGLKLQNNPYGAEVQQNGSSWAMLFHEDTFFQY